MCQNMGTDAQRLECVQELKAFVRGGTPGLARLSQVYGSIMRHYAVDTPMAFCQTMHDAGVPSEMWMPWTALCFPSTAIPTVSESRPAAAKGRRTHKAGRGTARARPR